MVLAKGSKKIVHFNKVDKLCKEELHFLFFYLKKGGNNMPRAP